MAIIDTTADFTHVRSAIGSRSTGRLLMTLLGQFARLGRPVAPTAAGSFAEDDRRDPAGPLGRHTDRWLDMVLRHRM